MISGIEYLQDGKRLLNTASDSWDIFISAYNDSDRVKHRFDEISASRKIWWILPEYNYDLAEISHLSGAIYLAPNREENVVKEGLHQIGLVESQGERICVDITGFMRPQILFLMAYFKAKSFANVDFIYTEPERYKRKADTNFSIGEDIRVESVAGYMGSHDNDMTKDVLLLGVGYDHHLISHAIQAKESATVIQLHSFPSLSADMYHESILRLDRVGLGRSTRASADVFFSSANDPFVTAAAVSDAIASIRSQRTVTNLYLCPLATKPQAVGFGLCYLKSLYNTSTSIIFPNSPLYSKETSKGVGRSWVYPIIF